MTLQQMETQFHDLSERVAALEKLPTADAIATPNQFFITNKGVEKVEKQVEGALGPTGVFLLNGARAAAGHFAAPASAAEEFPFSSVLYDALVGHGEETVVTLPETISGELVTPGKREAEAYNLEEGGALIEGEMDQPGVPPIKAAGKVIEHADYYLLKGKVGKRPKLTILEIEEERWQGKGEQGSFLFILYDPATKKSISAGGFNSKTQELEKFPASGEMVLIIYGPEGFNKKSGTLYKIDGPTGVHYQALITAVSEATFSTITLPPGFQYFINLNMRLQFNAIGAKGVLRMLAEGVTFIPEEPETKWKPTARVPYVVVTGETIWLSAQLSFYLPRKTIGAVQFSIHIDPEGAPETEFAWVNTQLLIQQLSVGKPIEGG